MLDKLFREIRGSLDSGLSNIFDDSPKEKEVNKRIANIIIPPKVGDYIVTIESYMVGAGETGGSRWQPPDPIELDIPAGVVGKVVRVESDVSKTTGNVYGTVWADIVGPMDGTIFKGLPIGGVTFDLSDWGESYTLANPSQVAEFQKQWADAMARQKAEEEAESQWYEEAGGSDKTAGVKFDKDKQKWFGWSHRGKAGFGVGSVVKKGDVIEDESEGEKFYKDGKGFKAGFKAKTLEDAKKMAELYAERMSSKKIISFNPDVEHEAMQRDFARWEEEAEEQEKFEERFVDRVSEKLGKDASYVYGWVNDYFENLFNPKEWWPVYKDYYEVVNLFVNWISTGLSADVCEVLIGYGVEPEAAKQLAEKGYNKITPTELKKVLEWYSAEDAPPYPEVMEKIKKEAGIIPGVPDGTGPWGGTDKCPMNRGVGIKLKRTYTPEEIAEKHRVEEEEAKGLSTKKAMFLRNETVASIKKTAQLSSEDWAQREFHQGDKQRITDKGPISKTKSEDYLAAVDYAERSFFEHGNRWSGIEDDLRRLYTSLTDVQINDVRGELAYKVEQYNIQLESSINKGAMWESEGALMEEAKKMLFEEDKTASEIRRDLTEKYPVLSKKGLESVMNSLRLEVWRKVDRLNKLISSSKKIATRIAIETGTDAGGGWYRDLYFHTGSREFEEVMFKRDAMGNIEEEEPRFWPFDEANDRDVALLEKVAPDIYKRISGEEDEEVRSTIQRAAGWHGGFEPGTTYSISCWDEGNNKIETYSNNPYTFNTRIEAEKEARKLADQCNADHVVISKDKNGLTVYEWYKNKPVEAAVNNKKYWWVAVSLDAHPEKKILIPLSSEKRADDLIHSLETSSDITVFAVDNWGEMTEQEIKGKVEGEVGSENMSVVTIYNKLLGMVKVVKGSLSPKDKVKKAAKKYTRVKAGDRVSVNSGIYEVVDKTITDEWVYMYQVLEVEDSKTGLIEEVFEDFGTANVRLDEDGSIIEVGLDNLGIVKTADSRREGEAWVMVASKKTTADAVSDVGSGKLPNKYYVTASEDFLATEDGHHYGAASETEGIKEVVSDVFGGQTFGPFDTFQEALDKFNEIYDSIGEEPVTGGFNSVVIEDHISGEIYSGSLMAKKTKFGWKFFKEYNDDTSFTSKALGYDIRQVEPKKDEGEEVEASLKRKTAQLSSDEWDMVNDAASDVASNYKNITGVDGWKLIDPNGQFHDDVVSETFSAVEEYVLKNYPEVKEDAAMWEEFLCKLDDELMESYADEAMRRAKNKAFVNKKKTVTNKTASVITKRAGLQSHVRSVIEENAPELVDKLDWTSQGLFIEDKRIANEIMEILDSSGEFGPTRYNPETRIIEFGVFRDYFVPSKKYRTYGEHVEGWKSGEIKTADLKRAYTPEEIAQKHGVEVKDMDKALQVGQDIEMEHTDDPEEAARIASHHLWENPKYYDEKVGLPAMERKLKVSEKVASQLEGKEDDLIETSSSKRTAAFDTSLKLGKKSAIEFMRNHIGPNITIIPQEDDGVILFYDKVGENLQHKGTYLIETKELLFDMAKTSASKKTAAFDTWFQKNKDNLKRIFDTARNPMGLDFEEWAKNRYQKFYSMASRKASAHVYESNKASPEAIEEVLANLEGIYDSSKGDMMVFTQRIASMCPFEFTNTDVAIMDSLPREEVLSYVTNILRP